MYRNALPNALFQGDLLVVPFLAIPQGDVPIVSDDPRPGAPPSCANCGAVPNKPAKEKRFTPASVRILKQEPIVQKSYQAIGHMQSVIAMVLSHACAVDSRPYISLAVVQPLSSLSPAEQEGARNETNPSYFHVPAVGRLPAAAVDLNLRFPLSAAMLGKRFQHNGEPILRPFVELVGSRITSLSQKGLLALYRALARNDARKQIVRLDIELSKVSYTDDPGRPQPIPLGWWWPEPGWLNAAPATSAV